MNKFGVVLSTGAMAVTAALVPAGAASAAAYNDSFGKDTGPSPSCYRYGAVQFVDHGEYGDDYVGVYDACKDGVGVKAWIWINGELVGAQRNGDGFNSEVYVDVRNLVKDDVIGLKVCAQDGPSGTPFACGSTEHKMHDG